MAAIKTLGAVTIVPGTPTPVLFAAANTPFSKYTISSVAYANGVMNVTLSVVLPANGFNPPNGPHVQNATTGASLDIHGGVAPGINLADGQQVILWGLGTYVDLNGVPVTVRTNQGTGPNSFSFNYSNPNAYTGTDTGSCAPAPFQQYRAVRLECGQANSTDLVYVGDNHVSSTRYMAALSLTGQIAVEVASNTVLAYLLCVDGTANTDKVQVSLIY